MTHEERLAEIIRADFAEDDLPRKKLNVEKFLKSDFLNRFLAFAKEYDTLLDSNVLETSKTWIKQKDYELIRYFLNCNPQEYALPFSLREFISMNYSEFAIWQIFALDFYNILEEKNKLYQEFNSFYE